MSESKTDVDVISTEDVTSDYRIESDHFIGKYSLSERSKRILKYKLKVVSRRSRCPISKKFTGRSRVATEKVRVNGRFVKRSDMLL